MVRFSDEGLPIIEHDGVERVLAWQHEEDEEGFKALPPYADSGYPILQASDLREVDHFIYSSPMKDQGRFGSCTNQTLTTAFDLRWRLMGREPVALSSTWNYANVNGGRDNGYSLSGIIKSGVELGFCLESQCPQNCIYTSQIRDINACRQTARLYKVAADGFFRCSTYLELLSAVILGHPTGFGILVGENFGNIDREGLCPLPDVVKGGHAMCGGRVKKSSRGFWMLGFQNSWTARFGQGGYGWLYEKHFDKRIDAWALVRPADTGVDFDKIPKAKT